MTNYDQAITNAETIFQSLDTSTYTALKKSAIYTSILLEEIRKLGV